MCNAVHLEKCKETVVLADLVYRMRIDIIRNLVLTDNHNTLYQQYGSIPSKDQNQMMSRVEIRQQLPANARKRYYAFFKI